MKKDVNVVLAALIVFMLLSTLGLVIYYKITYQNLGKRYAKARAEIDDASRQLEQTRGELRDRDRLLAEREDALSEKEDLVNKMLSELNISQQRETSLGDMFNTIKTENEDLQGELADKEDELEETQTDLGALTVSYNQKVQAFSTVRNACMNSDKSRSEIDGGVKKIGPALFAINDDNARLDDWLDRITDPDLKSDMNKKIEDIDEQVALINSELTAIRSKLKDMEKWGDICYDTE